MTMKVVSEDLLDGDGDLVDGEFNLDGADEDALLADDYDELSVVNKVQRSGSSRNQDRISSVRDATNEDEDAIDLGIADEDFALTEDDKLEGSSKSKTDRRKNEASSTPVNYTPKSATGGDSDEEDGERDRGRFKTERNITVRTRITSSIPETLDGVVVNRGGGGQNGNLRSGRGNIGRTGNQGTRGALRGNYSQQPMPNRVGGPQHRHMQLEGHHQQQPPVRYQSSNIHVNPHFKPRPPIVLPGWQVPANNFPVQPQYPPQYNNNQFPVGVQQPRPNWNEGMYYNEPPQAPMPYPPAQPDYFNGPMPPQPQEPVYYPPQQLPQPPMPNYQGGGNHWDNQGYYPSQPHDVFPQPPPQHQPPPMMEQQMNRPYSQPMMQQGPQTFARPQNQMRNQYQRNQGFMGGKMRGKSRMNQGKRIEGCLNGKMGGPGMKLSRLDLHQRKVIRNLHQVQTVDNLPQSTTEQPQPPTEEMEVEEDEEMKEYRLKIEEQKKLREQILRKKEEKRAEAAQQRQKRLGLIPDGQNKVETNTTNTDTPTANNNIPNTDKDSINPDLPLEQQFKVVKVRTQDGRTVVRKLSLAAIQKLKKITPEEKKKDEPEKKEIEGVKMSTESTKTEGVTEEVKGSKTVAVENLSATTTKRQLMLMARQVGSVQSIELDSEHGKGKVRFETASSASAFLAKFQRKMVDLSMISLSLVVDDN